MLCLVNPILPSVSIQYKTTSTWNILPEKNVNFHSSKTMDFFSAWILCKHNAIARVIAFQTVRNFFYFLSLFSAFGYILYATLYITKVEIFEKLSISIKCFMCIMCTCICGLASTHTHTTSCGKFNTVHSKLQ